MVLETGKHPGQLKDEVCSPGGTTISAMHSLEKAGFRGCLIDAVEVATLKAKELGSKNIPVNCNLNVWLCKMLQQVNHIFYTGRHQIKLIAISTVA
jgi:hypothetical protein